MTALELGLPRRRAERVRLAGLLHDVGKLAVPDRILNKRGPLTLREWDRLRKHPEAGARLLSHPRFDDVRGWVLAHHERMDGLGYPAGLQGEEIPLEARILAVADAYDAMTGDRAYREAVNHGEAAEELRACAGTQFDPEVVDAFLAAMDREWSEVPVAA